MIVGMGAAAFVVESAQAARERGLEPICEVLGAVTANSAFHGTRLDVDHIAQVMERRGPQAESRGVDRHEIAASTVFVSHETYTPARGGSAAAEVNALRSTFGPAADSIVIANTKGFTGHAMGAGIEDVVAIKALETGIVPPVPNYKEPDPALGELNLSLGGAYPVRHALRLAAGFGSQIAMSLLRWTPPPDGRHRAPERARLRAIGSPTRRPGSAGSMRCAAVPGARSKSSPVGSASSTVRQVLRRLPKTRPTRARRAGRLDQRDANASCSDDRRPPRSPQPSPPGAAVVPEPVTESTVEARPGRMTDEVTVAVVSIVAEMTGYPADLLDLDLDLEADLGVDTVKQAEVFAAVRERFGVERDESLSLREFPTLAHVIGWVRDKTGGTALAASRRAPGAPTPSTPDALGGTVVRGARAESPESTSGPTAEEVTVAVVSIVAEMTGYPADLLDLDLDLEADLGVDTVKQAEVFAAVRERFGVERDETLSLREFPTLAHVIGWVRDKTGDSPLAAQPASPWRLDALDALAPDAPATVVPVPDRVRPSRPRADAEEVTVAVVSIVAEMTGYPADLLDLDLDLEADLGVDTVKQAEVFAAVRERFGVERDESLSLREFPTLAHVIGWVRDKTGGPAGRPARQPRGALDALAPSRPADRRRDPRRVRRVPGPTPRK